MKNLTHLMSLCATAALVSTAFAGTDKAEEMKKLLEDQGIKANYVETKLPSVKLSGYVDTSYVYNSNGGGTDTGGRPNVARQFDVDSNDFSINAVKLALEKPLSEENEFTAGFRTDIIYGEDAKFLGGNDPANAELALEQAYVNFRIPVGNGLDIKMGKFVTLLGYEVIESPANLNFSRGLLFTFAIPLTHTGALASYKFNDTWDAQLGIVNGWNNEDSVFPAAQRRHFRKAVTGRVNWTAPGGNANIANSFIMSPTGENTAGFATGSSDVWVYDIWANWSPVAFKNLLLGFNADVGQADSAVGANDNLWWGVAGYAKYQFTPKFSLAARGEYFSDDTGIRTGFLNSGTDELYSLTLTAGFDLWENLLTRVEYRADFSDGGQRFAGEDDQHTIGVNLVYSF
ncbi:MAG: outer membrane beta-barrel protein [Verrucomicrobiota bacterium]|nr:outer membrane beta-barrel protein [Verrucomicrobiota bacterium]